MRKFLALLVAGSTLLLAAAPLTSAAPLSSARQQCLPVQSSLAYGCASGSAQTKDPSCAWRDIGRTPQYTWTCLVHVEQTLCGHGAPALRATFTERNGRTPPMEVTSMGGSLNCKAQETGILVVPAEEDHELRLHFELCLYADAHNLAACVDWFHRVPLPLAPRFEFRDPDDLLQYGGGAAEWMGDVIANSVDGLLHDLEVA